jgi:hypothetical protein
LAHSARLFDAAGRLRFTTSSVEALRDAVVLRVAFTPMDDRDEADDLGVGPFRKRRG